MSAPPPPGASSRPRRKRRGRAGRILLWVTLGGGVAVLALWVAVNRITWLGPYVADGLRSVVGVDAVASLEDFAYRLQDRVNRVWRRGEQPRAYWTVPATPAPAAPAMEPTRAEPKVAADVAADPPAEIPPFQPKPVGPVHKAWSAPGDGDWVPMVDPDRADAPVTMMKTLLHPDKNRSWAEVFVVAIDLRQVRIHLLPGTKEPLATEEEAQGMARPGFVLPEHQDRVLAAFNGGFKTEHGEYGMYTQGTLLVKPKAGVCAIAAYDDDTMRIATWDKLEATRAKMVFWRETPGCMYEDDQLHFRLADPQLAKKWGATLDGETVIRRSAIGIDRTGSVLYVSISNHTTARVIADGMHHAGAVTVAQLDVNFSYPKFVTFEKKKGAAGADAKRVAIPLADGFEFSEDEYIREPSRRDFFYVVPRSADDRTALKTRTN